MRFITSGEDRDGGSNSEDAVAMVATPYRERLWIL